MCTRTCACACVLQHAVDQTKRLAGHSLGKTLDPLMESQVRKSEFLNSTVTIADIQRPTMTARYKVFSALTSIYVRRREGGRGDLRHLLRKVLPSQLGGEGLDVGQTLSTNGIPDSWLAWKEGRGLDQCFLQDRNLKYSLIIFQ